MSDRNIDIEPEDGYESIQNEAANAFVSKMEYGGSYEALALKQAFVMGANTATSADAGDLAYAALMGRRWALSKR